MKQLLIQFTQILQSSFQVMIIMQQNLQTFASSQNFGLVHTSKILQEVSIQGRLQYKDREQFQRSRFPQKCRKSWSRRQRQQYALTLQAFQNSQITMAEEFYDHLSELLGRSPRQVRAFHIKMMSEYVYARRVVTSILGKRITPKSTNKFEKTIVVKENALVCNYVKENILVQNFSSNQHLDFADSSVALTSLDQYEDSSEEIQIYELQQEDDDQNIKYYQDWSTDGSEERPSSQYVQMNQQFQQ